MKKTKKFLSILLSVLMIISAMPMTAFAEETHLFNANIFGFDENGDWFDEYYDYDNIEDLYDVVANGYDCYITLYQDIVLPRTLETSKTISKNIIFYGEHTISAADGVDTTILIDNDSSVCFKDNIIIENSTSTAIDNYGFCEIEDCIVIAKEYGVYNRENAELYISSEDPIPLINAEIALYNIGKAEISYGYLYGKVVDATAVDDEDNCLIINGGNYYNGIESNKTLDKLLVTDDAEYILFYCDEKGNTLDLSNATSYDGFLKVDNKKIDHFEDAIFAFATETLDFEYYKTIEDLYSCIEYANNNPDDKYYLIIGQDIVLPAPIVISCPFLSISSPFFSPDLLENAEQITISAGEGVDTTLIFEKPADETAYDEFEIEEYSYPHQIGNGLNIVNDHGVAIENYTYLGIYDYVTINGSEKAIYNHENAVINIDKCNIISESGVGVYNEGEFSTKYYGGNYFNTISAPTAFENTATGTATINNCTINGKLVNKGEMTVEIFKSDSTLDSLLQPHFAYLDGNNNVVDLSSVTEYGGQVRVAISPNPADHEGYCTPATCTEDGYCSFCNAVYKTKLGHDYSEIINVISEATCVKQAVCDVKCSRCDSVLESIEFGDVNSSAHNWKAATCTEPKTCLLCGATEGRALGHDFDSNACKVCGASAFVIDENGVLNRYLGNGGDVVIPAGVTAIGNRAFYNCASLTNIVVPNSVTTIESHAFYGCGNLESITIPNGVTTIEDHVFYGCGNLVSITIPNSLTSIGGYTFYYCNNLRSVYYYCSNDLEKVKPLMEPYSDALKYNPIHDMLPATCTTPKTCKICCATEGHDLGHIFVDDVCIRCGESAFVIDENGVLVKYITEGYEVVIPDGVTAIGDYAFENQYELVSVVIPDSVTKIGDYAFVRCENLKNINIPDSVTSIGDYAFVRCENLKNINIPDGVTSIGEGAFSNCDSLTSVNIPDGITEIKNSTFNGCLSLVSFTIPDGVTAIGDHAFHGCTSLESIAIPDSVASIGVYVFYGCESLKSISIPNGVELIYDYTLAYCSNLESITVPNTLLGIANGGLYSCPKLHTINYQCGTNFDNLKDMMQPYDNGFEYNLVHDMLPATCTEPKHCACYELTEGEINPNAHDWQDATFDTPKTCSLCHLTDGDKQPSANVRYINPVNREEVTFDLTNDNVNTLFKTPMQFSDNIFLGWFANDTALDKTVNRFEEFTNIVAFFTSLGRVDRDIEDEKNIGSYKEFELAGVQIRPDYCIDTNIGEAYGGMRFIGSLSEDLISRIGYDNIIEYGFVTASLENAQINADGNDDYVIKSGDKNVKRINCNNGIDHRNFSQYRLFTMVIDYAGNEELKDQKIVARAYIIYRDANGVARIYYSDYDGTNTYGGCSISYNQALRY